MSTERVIKTAVLSTPSDYLESIDVGICVIIERARRMTEEWDREGITADATPLEALQRALEAGAEHISTIRRTTAAGTDAREN